MFINEKVSVSKIIMSLWKCKNENPERFGGKRTEDKCEVHDNSNMMITNMFVCAVAWLPSQYLGHANPHPKIQGYSKAPGGCGTDAFINIHHTLQSTNLSAHSLLSLDTQRTFIRAAPRSSAASVRSVDHNYYLIKSLKNSPLQKSSGLGNHTALCEVSVGELGQSCTIV